MLAAARFVGWVSWRTDSWGARMADVSLRIGSVEITVDSRTDELLQNWGEWVSARASRGLRRTGSAEGLYRSEPARSASGTRRIDAAAAAHIEAVLSAPAFPPAAAALLRYHYAARMDPSVMARKLGVTWRSLPYQTKAAVDLLAERLT